MAQWEEDVRDLRAQTRQTSIEWIETPLGLVWVWTRRVVGDLVWVRIADFIAPNIDQVPVSLPLDEETQELAFDPPRTTTWTVPVDDTSTMGFGFSYRREQGARRAVISSPAPAAKAGPTRSGNGSPATTRRCRANAPSRCTHLRTWGGVMAECARSAN